MSLTQDTVGHLSRQQKIGDTGLCPLTKEEFKTPVIASDGYTYEKEALEMLMRGDEATSPKTGEELDSREIKENKTLADMMKQFEGSHTVGNKLCEMMACMVGMMETLTEE